MSITPRQPRARQGAARVFPHLPSAVGPMKIVDVNAKGLPPTAILADRDDDPRRGGGRPARTLLADVIHSRVR
jgi:hypothetical protein